MLRRLVIALALVLCAHGETRAESGSEHNLNALADEVFWSQQERALRPDLSARGNEKWVGKLIAFERRLGRIKASRLGREGKTTRELLLRTIAQEKRHVREGWIQQDLNGQDSLLLTTYEAINAVDRSTVADWRWVISSLKRSDRFVRDYVRLLELGMASGRMQPRDVVHSAIEQAQMFGSKSLARNPFLQLDGELARTLKGHPRLPELRRELRAALATAVPSYSKLHSFLRRRYLPKAPARPGKDPNSYRYYVDKHLGPGYSPEKLAKTGRREVAKLYAEIERTARRINPQMKSLSSFMSGLGRRKSESFASGAQLLKVTREEVAKARRLSRAHVRLPRGERVDVRPMHAADEATEDAQYISGDRTSGTFHINSTQRLNAVLRHELPSVVTHETYGGHHVQGLRAQKNASLPEFRRSATNSSFDEGWAMYADHLRFKSGGYTPLERIGHLKFALWAAAQLVVDVEVNTGKMSRSQAERFMAKYMFASPDAVAAEVERMLNTPGHALSYYVGRTEMLRLRRLARRTLGAGFNEKNFHDKVLASGALPLPLLRKNIATWLRRSKAQRKSAAPRPKRRRPRSAATTNRGRRPALRRRVH